MPLLIPGLDEAGAKTLTKRLHKSLKSHEGTPTLTQLQTLMAQAMGHQDWHAARLFWENPAPATRTPTIDGEHAEEVEDHLRACLELLEQARQGEYNALLLFHQSLRNVEQALLDHGQSRHAEKLIECAKNLPAPDNGSDAEHIERLERLVLRTQIELWPDIGHGKAAPTLPEPSPGIEDEDVSDPPPLTEEEEAERERKMIEWHDREYEELQKEWREERNKQQPMADQILKGLRQCVEDAKTGTSSFFESLQSYVDIMESSYMGIYHYPDEALHVARELTTQTLTSNKRVELLKRFEYCQRRIQAKILERFFPDRPRERFTPAWEELLIGATLIGHWELMEEAISLSQEFSRTFSHRSYEDSDAVRLLCNWWNSNAPKGQRKARAFFIGVLSDSMVSYMGYNECPRMFPEDFSKDASYALFPSPRGWCYVVHFVQGVAKQTRNNLGVTTYQADGREMWTIGTDDKVDESHYAIDGLHHLKGDMETRIRD